MTIFYGEKLIFFRVPYSMRERFFENFYYRWIFIFSVGLWKWLLYAIYVASILALKYALIIDETYIQNRIRSSRPLYKLTFVGRKSAKHLIGSNHWFHEYVHDFQKLKIFTKTLQKSVLANSSILIFFGISSLVSVCWFY